MKPQFIADYCCDTGEGPVWHEGEGRLYWTDIPSKRVFRYDPKSGLHEQCLHGRLVSGMTVQTDGSFVIFGENGSIAHWNGRVVDTLIAEIPDERGTRFNDVAVDPVGRIFCGTMPSPNHPGRLYLLDLDGKMNVVIEGVKIPNGIGFTGNKSTMYFCESAPGIIHAFDYHASTGTLTNQRQFATVDKTDGSPDGLTVDADDYVWSARWDGSCIVRYSPDGGIDLIIEFPVPKVSSLTFGGPNYRDLYITTAGGHQKNVDGPLAGTLFVIKGAGQGRPDYLSNIVKQPS
jgi:sugar lactone lactonase YvrE